MSARTCPQCGSGAVSREPYALHSFLYTCLSCSHIRVRRKVRPGTRDSQRGRLYSAENKAFRGAAFEPFEEIAHFLHSVYTSARFEEIIQPKLRVAGQATGKPNVLPTLVVSDVGRRSYSSATLTHIELSNSGKRKWIAIHELAHVAVLVAGKSKHDPGHGPIFCATYLLLVREFLGADQADALVREFDAHRVKF